ncbi:hypothetical protein NDU88_004003 [Pleurodeles waltl]|uniref:Uncharacterized protein n=1 Tax=Pleurodeles waltl TaxID=8319 RepID=A0AAV7T6V4_PLEWA|nr:hypothetical protein NDU88_004003 [Pleurodeles waltl]
MTSLYICAAAGCSGAAPHPRLDLTSVPVAHIYWRLCCRCVAARSVAGTRCHDNHFSGPSVPHLCGGPVQVRVGQSAPPSEPPGDTACAGRAPGLSSATRSLSVGSSAGQNPNIRSGVSRAPPLLLMAPPVRALPSTPERGRHPDSSAGHPVHACCVAGLRCSVFLSVLALSHTYLVFFMCSAWEFDVLSGSFYGLWTELSLERPFTAPS